LPIISADLAEKMVLLAGPRQCGKTTLAMGLVDQRAGAYFSWDAPAHRRSLQSGALPEDAKLWVFDELHKWRSWRNWLKGVYDLNRRRHEILVTGSGRLDYYSHGGDSLQGRYLLHRLHPFTLGEVLGTRVSDDPDDWLAAGGNVAGAQEALDQLLRLGGFPEPYVSGSDRRAARWRLGYGDRLVREELRDLERLRDLDKIELLFQRLPELVGSVLSLNALREDLEVAFETVKTWTLALERLYAVFRLSPWGPPRIKAVKKEQKLYFWDWGHVAAEPARLENLVVAHLVRLTHWLEDVHGERAEVRFARDVVGHEIDAVVLRKGRPWLAVEVKTEDRPLDPGLKYFLERARVPYAFQLSLRGSVDRRLPDVNGAQVRLLPAAAFLARLP
jgi:predicted AAA+ superfamily ATPase